MATRMIVTSQPDVACDVCGRRLLRGEQPDVFLASGRRRMVCELCAPRASAEGWLRETDQARTLSLGPARPRQVRNPLARLRRPRRAGSGSVPEPVQASAVPAQDALGDELAEAVDGGLQEPVLADATPVFAGALVEPVAAAQAEIVAVEEPEIAEAQALEPAEEGSWRDAWMFVKE